MHPARLFFVRFILSVILIITVNDVVFLGLLPPMRVESGSMAETVKGPHYRVICGECGYEFACDATKPPASGYATCPLCGNAKNKLDDKIHPGKIYPGDRLFIDRTAFWWRSPRRWEPIVFRDPDGGQLALKRIVGLPGETIAIRDGEVYADGKLLEKPEEVHRAMGILVSDTKYVAKHRGREESPHPGPLPKGEGDEKRRVLDNYGYNQTESRRLNEVRRTWTVKDGEREQVYRDVYYTDVPRPGTGKPLENCQLGPDEYFVLGDNSPISDDSRHWPHPGLPSSTIVGKPLGVR